VKVGQNVLKFKGEETHTQKDDTRRNLSNFQKRTWTTNTFYPAPEFECHLLTYLLHGAESLL